MPKGVIIPMQSFLKEHKHLIKVLSQGSRKQQMMEAKTQAKELIKRKK